MIGIKQYRSFVAVAEELHFGRAAEKLGVAQPAVSRDILTLEKYLRSNLLRRSTRKVELTELGQRYYARIVQAMAQIDHATQLARLEAEGQAGALRIAYMDFSMHGPMVSMVRDFRHHYPNVTVELVNSYTDRTVEWLMSARVDAGVIVGDLNSALLNHRTLTTERLVVLLPEGHRLEGQEAISFDDLNNELFILGSREYWRTFRRTVDRACATHSFVPKVSQEASSSDIMLGLVEIGAGITFYPEGISERLSKGLILKPLVERMPLVKTTLAWHRDNESGPLARFLDIAKRQRFGRTR